MFILLSCLFALSFFFSQLRDQFAANKQSLAETIKQDEKLMNDLTSIRRQIQRIDSSQLASLLTELRQAKQTKEQLQQQLVRLELEAAHRAITGSPGTTGLALPVPSPERGGNSNANPVGTLAASPSPDPAGGNDMIWENFLQLQLLKVD